jgi:hypothetical protein
MGGGAFERLKAGRFRPESAEQRKAGLAEMSKILSTGQRPGRFGLAGVLTAPYP